MIISVVGIHLKIHYSGSLWKKIYSNSNGFPQVVFSSMYQGYLCGKTHGWFTMTHGLVFFLPTAGCFLVLEPVLKLHGHAICLAKAKDGCCYHNSSWHGAIGVSSKNAMFEHMVYAVLANAIFEFVLKLYIVSVMWDSLNGHWTSFEQCMHCGQ